MNKRVVLTTMAITSMMAVTSLCTSCGKAEAKTKPSSSSADSSSMTSVSSAVDVAVSEHSITVEVGTAYKAGDLAEMVLNAEKVVPVSATTNSKVSIIDSSSLADSDYSYKFKDGATEKTFDTLGANTVVLSVTTPDGGVEEWKLSIEVSDTKAPEFRGIKDISIDEDATVNLKSGVSVTDNYDKEIQFTAAIDPADKKPNAVGEHTIIYTARDSSGNETKDTAKLTIKQVFEEMDSDMYVTADKLTAYTARDMKVKAMVLSKGDKVHVSGKVKGTNTYRIEVVGKVYFVDGTKLSKNKPDGNSDNEEQPQEQQEEQNDGGYEENPNEGSSDNGNGGSDNNGGGNQNPETRAPEQTEPPQTKPPKPATTEPPKTEPPKPATTPTPEPEPAPAPSSPSVKVDANGREYIDGYGDMGWGYECYYRYYPDTGEYIYGGVY